LAAAAAAERDEEEGDDDAEVEKKLNNVLHWAGASCVAACCASWKDVTPPLPRLDRVHGRPHVAHLIVPSVECTKVYLPLPPGTDTSNTLPAPTGGNGTAAAAELVFLRFCALPPLSPCWLMITI
jgi:hypothetical protein